jgi:hypothetical protein
MGNIHGTLFIFGIAVAGWLIDDMIWTRGVPIEKYFFIAVLLVVTANAGAKWFVTPPQTSIPAQKKSD